MDIIKVCFGGLEPAEIDYKKNSNSGLADVWLYNNISKEEIVNAIPSNEEEEESSYINYTADAVHLMTMLSKEEILAQKDSYFVTPEPETTVEDLAEALDILTDIVLGGEE